MRLRYIFTIILKLFISQTLILSSNLSFSNTYNKDNTEAKQNNKNNIQKPSPPIKPIQPEKHKLKTNNNNKSTKSKTSYNVQITNFKGSRVKGKIFLKGDGIHIKTLKDDFTFYKKHPFSNIKSIEPKAWKERNMDTKEKLNSSSNAILFVFIPTKFLITTKDNTKIVLNKRIKQLEKIVLENNLGRTTIFGLFYDYWLPKDSPFWLNSKSSKFSFNLKVPNPKVWKEILFLN